MRVYLDSSNFCLAQIHVRDSAYYGAYMVQAWRELCKARLYVDTKTRTVYESGAWIERPTAPVDMEPEISTQDAFDDYLSRHVKARAARLFNLANS